MLQNVLSPLFKCNTAFGPHNFSATSRTLAVKDTVSDSQDLSNTVWACGTLLEVNPPLLAAVSHQSVLKLHLFLKLCLKKEGLNFEQLTCFTFLTFLFQFDAGLEAEGHVYEFCVSTKEPRAVQHSLGVFKAIHGRNAPQAWALPESNQSNQSLDIELTCTILWHQWNTKICHEFC